MYFFSVFLLTKPCNSMAENLKPAMNCYFIHIKKHEMCVKLCEITYSNTPQMFSSLLFLVHALMICT